MTAAPTGIAESCTDGKFYQAGEYAVVGSMGENRLPQPVPIPKKFSGIVWKRSGRPGGACSKGIPGDSVEKFRLPRQTCSEEIAGTGQTGGISPEAPAWGQQPADTRTEKHPEGHRAFRVFCYVREITSSGRFRTTAESPSGRRCRCRGLPDRDSSWFSPLKSTISLVTPWYFRAANISKPWESGQL